MPLVFSLVDVVRAPLGAGPWSQKHSKVGDCPTVDLNVYRKPSFMAGNILKSKRVILAKGYGNTLTR